MKRWMSVAAAGLAVLWGSAAEGEVRTEWAYHGAGEEGRLGAVPGGGGTQWLEGGQATVEDVSDVTLWVLTDHEFAGDADEQVFVRWWDGYMAHWIMGTWVRNVRLGGPDGRLNGQPDAGERLTDLWRIDVPAWVTQPGENYYAIQLKGGRPGGEWEAKYLLRREAGDFSRRNALGQVYSSSEEFDGADWAVTVRP